MQIVGCWPSVLRIVAAIVVGGAVVQAKDRGVTNTSLSPHVKLRSVDMDDVRWTDGFWAERYDRCRKAMIPTVERSLNDPANAARLSNFRVAAGLEQGKHQGTDWGDGDCYKWIEAMAHVYALTRDPRLDRLMDQWIEVIGKAQADDGYISMNVQLGKRKGRFTNTHHHEMYNMGHLLTAACIHHRATGKDNFLRIARRLGDFLYKKFQPRPPELAHYGWNPSHIMGMAELYRTTRDPKYLELVGIFVDMRGSAPGGTDLTQDRVPLRKGTEAVGHCVCATYLYCGAADVCAETGDPALLKALERIWQNATGRRMYITGAVGSFRGGKSSRGDPVHEAFGVDYELPSRTAYCETCSNIGNAMWNRRMLSLTGDARYADVMERVLYNSMLSAVDIDGKGFFYCNPLKRDTRREGLSYHHTPVRWAVHRCFCCPPQVARTIAKLQNWAYDVSDGDVWVHLYGGNVLETELADGSAVKMTQDTNYPWDGNIKLAIDKTPPRELAVMLRIPGWAEKARIRVNSKEVSKAAEPGTYAELRRKWSPGDVIELELPMEVRLMEANPGVKNLRNMVAVMRGPLVYCAEFPLEQDGARIWKEGVFLPENIRFKTRFEKDLLGGVVVLDGQAVTHQGKGPFEQQIAKTPKPAAANWGDRLYRLMHVRELPQPKGGTIPITLIPYYAWANRGESYMEVWIPLATVPTEGIPDHE